jgi:hypothetical protein
VGGASLLGFPRSVAIKEQDYAGHFAYLLVSDDPTSPTYIRKPGNRIVSVVVLWNTGKDKGTFYSTRIFAVFFHLAPHDYVLLNEDSRRHRPASRR